MSSTTVQNFEASTGSKARGCFQCSKRRITCDLGHPTCKKCTKKGIECSGQGRFRFSDGVARRGKFKGCQIPALDESAQQEFAEGRADQQALPLRIRWQNEKRKGSGSSAATSTVEKRHSKRRRVSSDQPPVAHPESSTKELVVVPGHHVVLNAQETPADFATASWQRRVPDRDIASCRAWLMSVRNQMVPPWLAPLSPDVRMLFHHFSEAVAPVMVVLDDVSNGYRDFILPMACENEVLRRAIGVVAAQHLGQKRPDLQLMAERGRAAIISRLLRDAQHASPDQVFNIFTWTTLIVLLVGETVTGSTEYGYLVQMLLCLSRNNGHTRQLSPLNSFLAQQTHMFEFLARPLLEGTHGTIALANPPDHYLDFLSYELPPGSDCDVVISTTRQAFIEASKLYTHRTMTENERGETLERLQQLVHQVDPEAPGAHALVWVCFLGAAESTDEKSRRFFTVRMNRIYSKTGFRNIPAAIESLEKIWSESRSGGWLASLSEASPVLIM